MNSTINPEITNHKKKYFKKREFTLEKRNQRKYFPSTNHGQSLTKSKLRTKLSSAMEQTGIDQSPWLSETGSWRQSNNGDTVLRFLHVAESGERWAVSDS